MVEKSSACSEFQTWYSKISKPVLNPLSYQGFKIVINQVFQWNTLVIEMVNIGRWMGGQVGGRQHFISGT